MGKPVDEKHDGEGAFVVLQPLDRFEHDASCFCVDTRCGSDLVDVVEANGFANASRAPEEIEADAIGASNQPAVGRMGFAKALAAPKKHRAELLQRVLGHRVIAEYQPAAAFQHTAIPAVDVADFTG